MVLKVDESRLRALIDLAGASPVFFAVGDIHGMPGNTRSAAMITRLFDLPELTSNVAVLVKAGEAHVYAQGAVAAAPHLTVHLKESDFTAAVRAAAAQGTPISTFIREVSIQAGAWVTALFAAIADLTAQATEAAPIATAFLTIKEKQEVESLKKASAVTAFAFKRFVIERMRAALASPKPPTEKALSMEFDDVLAHPKKLPDLESMDQSFFDVAFAPSCVQSQPGQFRLQQRDILSSQTPLDVPLRGPCLSVALGSRYKGYCALCERTFLVEPCPDQLEAAYEFINAVLDHVLSALATPGVALKDVHAQAMDFAKAKDASLASLLAAEFGFTTGLHFADPAGQISPRGVFKVADGLTLVVRVAILGVKPSSVKLEQQPDAAAKEETFGLAIAETVVIEGGKVKVLTKVDRGLTAAKWGPISTVASTADTVAPVPANGQAAKPEYVPRVTRGAAAAIGLDLESARAERQMKIFKQKREDWVAAGSPQGVQAVNAAEDSTALGRLARGALTCYKDTVPPEFLSKRLAVDRAAKTLLVPVGDQVVPFHISTISKVTSVSAGAGKVCFTVTFATTQQSNVAFARHRNRQWVKELVYVRNDVSYVSEVLTAVHEVQRMIKDSDAKSKQNAGLAETEPLRKAPNALRLPSVRIRPSPSQGTNTKNTTAVYGNLDAHLNGFRFSSPGVEVDVPYSNVKHCIFQPARKETVVVLHLQLRHPMMIGTKKSDSVQFFAEVLEATVLVSNQQRKNYEEELEAEERDLERVRETNRQFAQFAKQVTTNADLPLELPLAGDEFRFQGVAHKRMTWFNVNEHAMWSVSEPPFFVISLEDIEVVSLERVMPGQQNFDAMFIHKDYKTVTSVPNISMTHLETFKDWLCEARLVYFESNANITWTKVLKIMRDDKEWEAWGPGGWIEYVNPHADEGEGEEGDDSEEDDDEDYEESSDEEEEDDDEEDSEWAEEGSSSELPTDDSDASDGSWSSVERKAAEADAKRGRGDSDSDRPKRPRGHATAQPTRRPPQQPRPAPPRR